MLAWKMYITGSGGDSFHCEFLIWDFIVYHLAVLLNDDRVLLSLTRQCIHCVF